MHSDRQSPEKKIHKWRGLFSFIPAIAIVFLDQSILPVALPTIQREFQASTIALQWCVNAYLLSTAMFVLVAGKISDRIGHRRAFLSGMLLFGLFSTLCGLSANVNWLLSARFLQGVGAALMFPSQSALIASLFPPQERGRATGLIISTSSLFLILGPLLGGYLTQSLSWRWIFWINIPIIATGFPIARVFLPYTQPSKAKIDLLGFLFFAVFAFCLIVFFMQAPSWGWLSLKSLSGIFLALVGLALMLSREKKAEHPFLDLSLFKRPAFAAINISVSITQFILMITVFRSIYFQTVLDYTPFQTGLITFTSCLPVLFFSSLGGYLSDKVSPKLPIALGFFSLIFSCVWFGIFSVPSLTNLLIALLPFGMGIPLIFTPSYSSAMSAVPSKKLGIAFGMVSTLRNFSATMGVALIGLFLNIFKENRLQALAGNILSSNQIREVSLGKLPIQSLPEASSIKKTIANFLLQSEIASFSATHFTLALILLIAFVAFYLLHRRKSAHELPNSPAEGWD